MAPHLVSQALHICTHTGRGLAYKYMTFMNATGLHSHTCVLVCMYTICVVVCIHVSSLCTYTVPPCVLVFHTCVTCVRMTLLICALCVDVCLCVHVCIYMCIRICIM